MEVTTTGERLDRHRATLTELLLSDQPDPAADPKETTTGDNELLVLVRQYGVAKNAEELPQGEGRGIDDSNPVIAVNHERASCATAACGPATTSRATTSSAAAARATPPDRL